MRERSRVHILVALLFGTLSCSDSSRNPADPDPTPAISVADQTVAEGNTALFRVSLDQVADRAVVFSFATADISAQAGSDYTAVSGTDTVIAGQTGVTVLVLTSDDAEAEDTETFSFQLSSVSGATVSRAVATGTINDNDGGPVSFEQQVQPVLQTSCAKPGLCHGSGTPGGGLYLGVEAAYADVINATGQVTGGSVVVPYNSAASPLYTTTTAECPPQYGRMPTVYGLDSLSSAEQGLIRDWIDQGAQDN